MNREKFFARDFPSEDFFPHPSSIIDQNILHISNEVSIERDFIPYKDIISDLRRLRRAYPDRLHLEIIGKSKEDKKIYMAAVGKNLPYSTLSTIIEAGSHGKEWYSVTSALYLIDFLVKSPNAILLMDYYIIPCLNPDAYDHYLKRRKKRDRPESFRIDLTPAFPKVSRFQDAYFCCPVYDPEVKALYRVLDKYKHCIKMFITLREKGRAILYPWAHSTITTCDTDTLHRVALSGQKAMMNDICIGTIAERGSKIHGATVDYVKFYHPSVKFTYLLNLSYKEQKCQLKILDKAQDVCDGVRAMARAVYKHFALQNSELVDINVKLPEISSTTDSWSWII